MSAARLTKDQPRKHTKSFTGCWTCRARKVKCDEGKPGCRQCRRKGFECEGYGVRLQWIVNDNDDVGSPYALMPRCKIASDPVKSIVPYNRIDRILHTLDSYTPQNIPTRQKSRPEPFFIECFGVFRTNDDQTPCKSGKKSAQLGTVSHRGDCDTQQYNDPGPLFDFSDKDLLMPAWESISPNSTLEDGEPLLLVPTISNLSEDDANMFCGYGETSIGDFGFDGDHSELQLPPIGLMQTPLYSCPNPSYLSGNERYLMYHYSNRVVHTFCVTDYDKSPWKTIHLPKALQATGELNIHGATSRIREALMSALLSISAICLSNDSKSHLQTDKALEWWTVANSFRGRAIRLLADAMDKDFKSKSRPKYKDFLATTLSMVTINVMHGDTDTCGIHLDGAYRLITDARRWKSKYSTKAQALHRVYFYLRVIFDSTTSRYNRSRRRCIASPGSDSVAPTDTPELFEQSTQPEIANPTACTDLGVKTRVPSYESIYGVPYSLLSLLNQVIELIDKVYDATNSGSISIIPEELAEECDELEKNIMDWLPNTNIRRETKENRSTSSEIIYHHTIAFYNALIIYFAQHIRLVGYRFLQQYVEAVIDSMEVIENVKVGAREPQVFAAPLYWPAFIAASEAFDPQLQERFRCWYKHVEVYRIEAMRTGINVLTEVWEAGPSSRNRTTSYWRAVVERSGRSLMLS